MTQQSLAPAKSQELSVGAQTTTATAMVQARYTIAQARPRDLLEFRSKILKECKRPGLAEVALYKRKIGRDFIEGPSVHLMRAARRCFTNIETQTFVLGDSQEKRLVRVTVIDLEANISGSKDVLVYKSVERRRLRDGQQALGQRVNSYGDTVYLVEATEHELTPKIAAEVAKAERDLIRSLIPSDLIEEAVATAREVREKQDAEDPDAALKRMVDGFAKLRVGVDDLTAWAGCALSKMSPAQLSELRDMWSSIQSGDAVWMDYVRDEDEEAKKQPKRTRKSRKSKSEQLQESLAEDVKEMERAKQEEPTPRYDEVYQEGTAALDAMAGPDDIPNLEYVMQAKLRLHDRFVEKGFSPESWHKHVNVALEGGTLLTHDDILKLEEYINGL